MGVREAGCGREANGADVCLVEPGAAVGQRAAGEELHHDQAEPVGLDVVEDPDDMGMVQAGQQLGLGGLRTSRGSLSRDDLDGDVALEPPVPAADDQANRADAQLGADPVSGKRLRDPQPR